MDKGMNVIKAIAANKELVAAVATVCGVSPDALRVELEVTAKAIEQQSTEFKLRDKLKYALAHDHTLEQINGLLAKSMKGLSSAEAASKVEGYDKVLDAIENSCNMEAVQTGLNLGHAWREMQRRMNGLHVGGYLYVVGGRAGSGKTTFMRNLGMNLVQNNRGKTLINYISLDDSVHEMIPHILSQMCGVAEEKIANTAQANAREKELIKRTWLVLKDLRDEFQVVDGTQLSSLADIKAITRHQREKYKDREIITFIDSFHDIRTDGPHKEERIRLGDVAKELKDLTVELNSTIVAGAHLNKLKERMKDGRMVVARPKREDLSETGTLDYEANMVFLCHNELDAQGDTYAEYREVVNVDNNVEFKPIIEICPAKNKITHRFKQTTFYKFEGDSSKLIEVSNIEVHEGAPRRQKETSRPTPPKGR